MSDEAKELSRALACVEFTRIVEMRAMFERAFAMGFRSRLSGGAGFPEAGQRERLYHGLMVEITGQKLTPPKENADDTM